VKRAAAAVDAWPTGQGLVNNFNGQKFGLVIDGRHIHVFADSGNKRRRWRPFACHDAGIAAHLYWTGGYSRSTEQHAVVHRVGGEWIVGRCAWSSVSACWW